MRHRGAVSALSSLIRTLGAGCSERPDPVAANDIQLEPWSNDVRKPDGLLLIRTLPIEIKHRQGAKLIEPPGAPGVAGRVDRALVRAVALARSWSMRLESGDAPSLKTLAVSEGYCDHHAARLLPLAWLAPDLVELILLGRQPPALSLGALTRRPLPVSWEDQRKLFRDLGRAR